MIERKNWTRNQLLIAFKLYSELPFGKLHSRNLEIVRYAKLIGRSPSALAMKLVNIASLDPVIRSSGRTGLTGASAADKLMWDEMQSDWEQFVDEIETAERHLFPTSEESAGVDKETKVDEDYTGFDRAYLSNTRIGQPFFRRAVLSAYESRCCISGMSEPKLLVASHIVPWRMDPKNRLNPRNGLCLSILHDRAFDLGIITIDEQMTIHVATQFLNKADPFSEKSISVFQHSTIRQPDKFAPDVQFLEFHRRNIFMG